MPPLSKPRFSLAVSETPTCGEIADALRRTTLPAMADRGFLRIAKGEWVLLSLASASPRLRIGAVRQSLYYRDSIRRMFMRAFA